MAPDNETGGAFATLPNIITLVRYALIPVLVWSARAGELAVFCVAFYVCGISDYMDGYVARRYGMATKLGSDLDNISDELLLVLSILFIYWLRKEVLTDHQALWAAFLCFAAFDRLLFYAKHKGRGRLHLYSGKTFQRAFYLGLPVIVAAGRYEPALYIVLGLGVFTFFEQSMLYITRDAVDHEEKSFIPLRYNIFKYMYRH
jgi:phosphatidylglycerophosphate synthase